MRVLDSSIRSAATATPGTVNWDDVLNSYLDELGGENDPAVDLCKVEMAAADRRYLATSGFGFVDPDFDLFDA